MRRQQVPDVYVKGGSKALDVVERDISLASFNGTYVGSMKTRKVGQRLL
jgi:hypothetical protein